MRNLKRALSLALASVMLLGMMVVGSSAASYPDVDASNNLEAIEVLKMLKLMEGDEKGSFNPKENVSRYQMAALVCKLLGLSAGGSVPFTDIASKDSWATPYVAACYNNGIVSGTSKTTFDGTRSVTAVEAGLMLMRTLNYFYNQSELGDNWKLSTIREANHIDLYRGINVYTDQILTRDDIAQMVLNALESDVVVANQGLDINVETGDSNVNITGQWTYTSAQNNFSEDYQNRNTGVNRDPYMQLCEKLYGNELKKLADGNGADDFQRPSNQWRYKGQKVTTPIEADVTYTAAVKGKQIYADLGNVDPDSYYVYLDGVQMAVPTVDPGDGTVDLVKDNFDITSGNNKKVGGNGVLTEVYLTYDNNNNSHVDIVMTRTFASEVSSTDKNDDGTYEITLVDETETFDYPEDLEPETVVLYTKTFDDPSSGADPESALVTTNEIKSLAVAKSVSGRVTHVKNADSFTMDGEPYSYSNAYNNTIGENKLLATSTVDFDMSAYLDPYGYVIMLKDVDTTTNYAYVIGINDGNYSDYTAKLLFSDGTTKVVDITKASYVALGNTDALNLGIVTWTKDSSNVYTLNRASDGDTAINSVTGSTGELKGERGKASLKVASTSYAANAKTVFFFHHANGTTDEYYAWIGFENYPGLDNDFTGNQYNYDYYISTISGSKAANSVVRAVYVESATDLTGTNEDMYSFYYLKGDEKLEHDNDLNQYYTLKAVVDGESTTVRISTNVWTQMGGKSALIDKVKVNKDGIVTNVTPHNTDGEAIVVNGDGFMTFTNGTYTGNEGSDALKLAAAAVKVTRLKDEIITFNDNGTIYNYSYAKNKIKVFEYDDGFKTRSLSSLNGYYNNLFVQIEDSQIIAIYYIK